MQQMQVPLKLHHYHSTLEEQGPGVQAHVLELHSWEHPQGRCKQGPGVQGLCKTGPQTLRSSKV